MSEGTLKESGAEPLAPDPDAEQRIGAEQPEAGAAADQGAEQNAERQRDAPEQGALPLVHAIARRG